MLSVGCFFLRIFLKMWTTLKIFIEFVTASFLFYVWVFWLRGMWGLGSPTRDRTCPPPPLLALEGEVLTTGPPEKSHGVTV